MAKNNLSQSQLNDPWDLPPCFLLRKNMWKNLRTYSGYWKEKEEELTAIRSAGDGESSSSSGASPPSYVGVRKTLEFYLKDGTTGGEGTKTDWIIHEYYDLREDDAGPALFLQEDMVLCKVFTKSNNKTDQEFSFYRLVELCMKAYKDLKQVGFSPSDIILDTELALYLCMYDSSKRVPTPPLNDTNIQLEHTKVLFLTQSLAKKLDSSCPNPEMIKQIASLIFKLTENSINFLTGMNITSERQNEDSGVSCDPDGKADNVWNHFTKICSASDPNEVYAACHRCDKVLKAHPKKHGTSHLKRHIHTCSSCSKPNPSTDEDREMLHHLRTVLHDPYEQQKMMDVQEDLTQLDPWDLSLTRPSPWYVTRSFNRQTQGGNWEEINKDFTAIRMDQKVCWKDIDKEITVIQMDHQLHMQVPKPQYMGLRRTLQFHHQDGSKVDWIMLEYQQLDDIESPAPLLQGCMVIRKVFRYDKDVVASAFSDLDRLLNADDGDEEYFDGDGVNTDITTTSDYMDTPSSCFVSPLGEVMNTDTATSSSSDYMDKPVDRKRKRTGAASGHKSDVWMHFTKIYNTDYGVVYVVCHTCDRGYTSGCSKNGTSHLRRHTKSCTSKQSSTGNAKDATAEWETEIRPLFLVLKNYGETEQQGCAQARSQGHGPAC